MPQLTDIGYIRELLSRHGFTFSKKLGQNFLINPSVCPRMADAAIGQDGEGIGVLEIGPGIGVLTHELAKRAQRVAAVELDQRLLPILEETLSEHQNITILSGDVMKLDLHRLLAEQFAGLQVTVCANLPYYITSPILMGLLESRLPVTSITVMVQKEAADRLCAAPGTRACGAVSLAVAYYAEPKVLFQVSRGSFMPAPKVDSSVIQLTIRPEPPVQVKDERLLFRLIRASFGQRRKTLLNAASAGGFDKQMVAALLEQLGIPPTVRAEQMTLEQFGALADGLAGG